VKSRVSGKNQHVVPHAKGWAVKGEGNGRATKVLPTQKQAIETATGIAKVERSEVVIHRPDGRIRDKNSYGNDPYPPKG